MAYFDMLKRKKGDVYLMDALLKMQGEGQRLYGYRPGSPIEIHRGRGDFTPVSGAGMMGWDIPLVAESGMELGSDPFSRDYTRWFR